MELTPYEEKEIKQYSVRNLKNNKEKIYSELEKLKTERDFWIQQEANAHQTFPGRKTAERKIAIQEKIIERLERVEAIEKKVRIPLFVPVIFKVTQYFKS